MEVVLLNFDSLLALKGVKRNDLDHHHHELNLVEAVTRSGLKAETYVVESFPVQLTQNVVSGVKLHGGLAVNVVQSHWICNSCESSQVISF
jgi:hypothetical protein